MSRQISGLSRLELKIVKCNNVPIADPNGKSDPFVQVYMENQFLGMTHVKKKDLDPVFDYKFPPIALTNLDTTLQFEIYDEDPGKDNDLLGRAVVRLDQIIEGTQTLLVEAVELKQNQLQSVVQKVFTVVRGAIGPFTITIDARILGKISFPETFLTLPRVESLVANPPSRITLVSNEDWENLSVLQQQEIVNCVESFCQIGHSEEQIKEDLSGFLSDLRHIRKSSNDNTLPSRAIHREDPAIKNSTKFNIMMSDGRFLPSSHAPIHPKYSLQLNLSEDETAFRRIIFRSRYVMLYWFEWIQAAFAYWNGRVNTNEFDLQSLMEDICEVKSNTDLADRATSKVEVKLDLNNRFHIKIDNKNFALDQLASIVVSADSVRPTNIVAEVQVIENEDTSYDCCELSDGFRRFKIDLENSEKVGPFDFSPDEGDDENLCQMNRVMIEAKHHDKVIGSGVLNLHDVFTHALAAGINGFVDGMTVPRRVIINEMKEYHIRDMTIVMKVATYASLSIQASLMDQNDQPIGVVQKISFVRDVRTTIIRATIPQVMFQASISAFPTAIKMEIYAPTSFGMSTLLGSYKLICDQLTEIDSTKVVELESNLTLHFTCNHITHRQEVETISTFRASNLRNNLWYGECGNLNSKIVKLLVFPDHHQLQLFSKCGDDLDEIELSYGIPWSKIRHVKPLTPAILSVHYHQGHIPQYLYLFNCPSDDLASLFAERIEAAKARDMVGQVLSNGDENRKIPLIRHLFNTVFEAISLASADFDDLLEKRRVVKMSHIKKLYLLEILHTRDWNDYGATRLHRELLTLIAVIEESFPVSSTSFYLDDFRNMVQRINALFFELEELFCVAIIKAVKEIASLQNRVTYADSVKVLLSAKSILQEFTRRIFNVIGPCFSYNFQYFLQQSPYADNLYSSQNAWRRIMLLHQQIQKKFDSLQSTYEKIFGLKFQTSIPLDYHLPFSYLQDSFVNSLIMDMKKTIYNNLKSATQDISIPGFIAVQDIVTAQLRALNGGRQIFTEFHNKDSDLVLDGIDLTTVKHEIFSLDDVNRQSGFIFLDTLLSMARKIEKELLLNSEDEWNLLFEPGTSNSKAISDLMMQEKWRRCIDYSMQVVAFASGLLAGESSLWRTLTEEEELRIIPEKANCSQVLRHHCSEIIIASVLDQLSSGLSQYLYYLKSLHDHVTFDQSSFTNNLFDLLSSIEHYLVVDRRENNLWDQIAATLRDQVLAKCLVHFFGVVAIETSSFSLNQPTISQLGHNIDALYGAIKIYLMEQHHINSEEGWMQLLQSNYPSAGFALLALSLLHNFITVEPKELSQHVALLVQYYQDCMINNESVDSSVHTMMKTAISHYLQMCFHLRVLYHSNGGITQLDSLVQECEQALSLINLESNVIVDTLSRLTPLNPLAIVFGKSRGNPLPNKPEGMARTPFTPKVIAWDVRPHDDLLRSYVFRPFTQQSSVGLERTTGGRRSSWGSFALTTSQPSLDRRGDKYSLLSKMHSLYARSEIEEVWFKIKSLHKLDHSIPLYLHSRMNQHLPSTSIRPPDSTMMFTEIQLLDMFYLPNTLLRNLTNSGFFLYTIIQIGDWIYATEKIAGGVFNANLLSQPIQIPIYHLVTSLTGSTSPMNGNAVKSQYLSEDIVIYVVYSTNESNVDVNVVNDRVIGLFETPLYHYHQSDQNRTPGRFLINTKDEFVERAQNAALSEGRKLPSLTFSYHIL